VLSPRSRRRLTSWISLIALIAGSLATPLAHALAMRAGGPMTADFCSVAGKMPSAAELPVAPGNTDRHRHIGECPCCNATASPFAIAPAASSTPILAPGAIALSPRIAIPLRAPSPWRAIQPRAPPLAA